MGQSLSRSGQPIRAQIILKGSGGDLTSGQPITSENVQEYISDPTQREHVRSILEENGFAIDHVGPFSIAVSAPRRRFEQFFRGKLQQGRERRPAWSWLQSPEIPEDLRDTVDTVVFPQPTRTMKS